MINYDKRTYLNKRKRHMIPSPWRKLWKFPGQGPSAPAASEELIPRDGWQLTHNIRKSSTMIWMLPSGNLT